MFNQTQGGQGELNLGWAFNAATETGTQSYASASNGTVNTPYISAGASTTPAGAAWTGATWTTGTWSGARWTGATWTGARGPVQLGPARLDRSALDWRSLDRCHLDGSQLWQTASEARRTARGGP